MGTKKKTETSGNFYQKILTVQHFGLIKGKLPTKASPIFMLLDTQCAMEARGLKTSLYGNKLCSTPVVPFLIKIKL